MTIDRDRRRLVQGILAGALSASPLARVAASSMDSAGDHSTDGQAPSPRAIVARALRPGLMQGGNRPDQALLADALGSAVARAAGEEAPVAGLRRLFLPTDVIGIKVNCIGGRGLSSHPDLVQLLTGWLQEAGLPARNILVWDRKDRELRAAGYTLNRAGEGVRVFGINREFDPKTRDWGPNSSRFARILVDDMTALINVGVIKDHALAGVSLGLKNWYGAIHNPRECHENNCHPYVAHLASSPLVRKKLRLTVLDGMSAQCHGGPQRNPRWIWPYEGILASTDPVAIEVTGTRIVEERRKERGLKSLAEDNRLPRAAREAAGLGLGESDPARIRIETV